MLFPVPRKAALDILPVLLQAGYPARAGEQVFRQAFFLGPWCLIYTIPCKKMVPQAKGLRGTGLVPGKISAGAGRRRPVISSFHSVV